MQITVVAKGDLGTHPVHGPIQAGQSFTIEEEQFADQLFERPSPEWQAPWERQPAVADDAAVQSDEAVSADQKGRKK